MKIQEIKAFYFTTDFQVADGSESDFDGQTFTAKFHPVALWYNFERYSQNVFGHDENIMVKTFPLLERGYQLRTDFTGTVIVSFLKLIISVE